MWSKSTLERRCEHILLAPYVGRSGVGQSLTKVLFLMIHIVADAVAGHPTEGRTDTGTDQSSFGVSADGLPGQSANASTDS